MYVQHVRLKNIRSFEDLTLKFEAPYAGWHVIIGDNGAGKSTLLRSIAFVLIGPKDILALWENFPEWVRAGHKRGDIRVGVLRDPDVPGLDEWDKDIQISTNIIPFKIGLNNQTSSFTSSVDYVEGTTKPVNPNQLLLENSLWNSSNKGWFSASFGPFRRFSGGDERWEKVYEVNPRLAAHLSVFREDVALKKALDWLLELRFKELEKDLISEYILTNLKKAFNQGGLLPHGTRIEQITSNGVQIIDGNQNQISLTEMSDGYRSVLSLTFELIRQLVRVYGEKAVFKQIAKGKMLIDAPGVVMIDEIDAHLHPTWQVRIGKWFTSFFPKIQFIVTTHSPLICQSAHPGSIWRLAAPGSDQPSGQVRGSDYNRLI